MNAYSKFIIDERKKTISTTAHQFFCSITEKLILTNYVIFDTFNAKQEDVNAVIDLCLIAGFHIIENDSVYIQVWVTKELYQYHNK